MFVEFAEPQGQQLYPKWFDCLYWLSNELCWHPFVSRIHHKVPPTAEEAGFCDLVEVCEIGDTNVIVFRQGECVLTPPFLFVTKSLCSFYKDKEESRVSTILIRGSTGGIMDDVERSLNDGINSFKALTKDGRLLPGGGATEIELAKQLTTYGEVRKR